MSPTRDLILAIDTSGPNAFVALADQSGAIIAEKKSLSLVSHSEELATLVQQCFDDSKRRISELKSIVVGRGPGSFTGLRIGLSYTLGVASALSLQVIPISSAEGAAIEFMSPGRLVVVLGDARREEVFVTALFTGKESTIERVIEDEIWAISEVNEKVTAIQRIAQSKEVIFVSQETVPSVISIPPLHTAVGLFKVLIQAPSNMLFEGAASLSQIEPNYVRRVSAKTLKERQSAHF